MSTMSIADPAAPATERPERAPLVLLALILAAAVANLNLSVANVALPDIGRALDASQTQLNLVAVGYSLGLAASVLYLGAVGDRYGRKGLLVLGTALSVPAGLLASMSGSVELLVAARLLGGLTAGMAFPTTLALVSALWAGAARTRSIALWSGAGGAMAALGPLGAGWLLTFADWNWVFVLTLPIALVALVLTVRFVPSGVNETTERVDHLGGILSVLLVAAAVLAINLVVEPDRATTAVVLAGAAVVLGAAFVLRQRRVRNPLYDLEVAARPMFWVAAVGGIVVFGSLMGAMFVGQQFQQNVLGFSTAESGASILPAALLMVVVAPRSARLVESIGSRATLLTGYAACFLGFLTMLLLWREGVGWWAVGLAYGLVGIGVGLAGTPASHSLTSAVPVRRVGMASATADLQRDLGGAVMQSIMGALLTAGYATAVSSQIADAPPQAQALITDDVAATLQKSYSSAANLAAQYPQYQEQVVEAARQSFTQGQSWAYAAGLVAVLVGGLVVWRCYPDRDRERELLACYALDDGAPPSDP
jgi:MFS transporter, DHA2 family, multidrug resistance protein